MEITCKLTLCFQGEGIWKSLLGMINSVLIEWLRISHAEYVFRSLFAPRNGVFERDYVSFLSIDVTIKISVSSTQKPTFYVVE